MPFRLSPALARARMVAPSVVIVLLTGAIHLYAQSRMAPTSLVLQVAPEEHLQVQNGSVALKIRLARGATARLWEAQSCASSTMESQVIPASGSYTIPLNTLTTASSIPTPGTMEVCLASSDGVLNDSQPVEIPATGSGTVVQGRPRSLPPMVFLEMFRWMDGDCKGGYNDLVESVRIILSRAATMTR